MDDVPKQAYTMGIKNIMTAKKILLVATGEAKADALYKSSTDRSRPTCRHLSCSFTRM